MTDLVYDERCEEVMQRLNDCGKPYQSEGLKAEPPVLAALHVHPEDGAPLYEGVVHKVIEPTAMDVGFSEWKVRVLGPNTARVEFYEGE